MGRPSRIILQNPAIRFLPPFPSLEDRWFPRDDLKFSPIVSESASESIYSEKR